MQGVLRTWHCDNVACSVDFDSWEKAPECPHCGCIRVSWVPGGGHIHGARTSNADAAFKDLVDTYGLGDMRHAREGETAKIIRTPPPAASPGSMRFGDFVTARPWLADPVNRRVYPTCEPAGVTQKITARVGQQLRSGRPMAQTSLPRNTRIEGRTKG